MAAMAWRVSPKAKRSLFPAHCPANWWRPRYPRTAAASLPANSMQSSSPLPSVSYPAANMFPVAVAANTSTPNPAFQLQMKLDIFGRRWRARTSRFLPRWGVWRAAVGLSQPRPSAFDGRCAWLSPARIASAVAGNPLPDRCSPDRTSNRRRRPHRRRCRPQSLCEEVEFFTNGEQNQLLVSFLPGPRQRFRDQALEAFADRVQVEIPALTGVGLFRRTAMTHWGRRSLIYTVCGMPLPGKPGRLLSGQSLSVAGIAAVSGEEQSGPDGMGPLRRRRPVRRGAGI